jgi:hypothetical protein
MEKYLNIVGTAPAEIEKRRYLLFIFKEITIHLIYRFNVGKLCLSAEEELSGLLYSLDDEIKNLSCGDKTGVGKISLSLSKAQKRSFGMAFNAGEPSSSSDIDDDDYDYGLRNKSSARQSHNLSKCDSLVFIFIVNILTYIDDKF